MTSSKKAKLNKLDSIHSVSPLTQLWTNLSGLSKINMLTAKLLSFIPHVDIHRLNWTQKNEKCLSLFPGSILRERTAFDIRSAISSGLAKFKLVVELSSTRYVNSFKASLREYLVEECNTVQDMIDMHMHMTGEKPASFDDEDFRAIFRRSVTEKENLQFFDMFKYMFDNICPYSKLEIFEALQDSIATNLDCVNSIRRFLLGISDFEFGDESLELAASNLNLKYIKWLQQTAKVSIHPEPWRLLELAIDAEHRNNDEWKACVLYLYDYTQKNIDKSSFVMSRLRNSGFLATPGNIYRQKFLVDELKAVPTIGWGGFTIPCPDLFLNHTKWLKNLIPYSVNTRARLGWHTLKKFVMGCFFEDDQILPYLTKLVQILGLKAFEVAPFKVVVSIVNYLDFQSTGVDPNG